jgi:hypothetical protein
MGGHGEREAPSGPRQAGARVAAVRERVCCAVPASRASRTTSAFERAGLVVAEDADLERARADGSIVLLAARPCPPRIAGSARSDARAGSAWAPVFTSRLIRTPYELCVRDDGDASAQLELLAAAVGLDRDHITIKPPPGWRGYGHPELWSPW